MAFENRVNTIPGQVAAGDLSADQHKFGVVTSTGVAVAGDGVQVDGVIASNPDTAGHAVEVLTIGSVAKVQAGGTIAAGDDVASDAAGLATATLGATDFIAGRALTGGAIGELVSVLLTMPGKLGA